MQAHSCIHRFCMYVRLHANSTPILPFLFIYQLWRNFNFYNTTKSGKRNFRSNCFCLQAFQAQYKKMPFSPVFTHSFVKNAHRCTFNHHRVHGDEWVFKRTEMLTVCSLLAFGGNEIYDISYCKQHLLSPAHSFFAI